MNLDNCRFLVVDDDALVGALVRSVLQKLNAASVDLAENGQTALRFIDCDERRPDIIISDIYMPQLDGVEFLTHLAKKHFTGGIVLISAADQRLFSVVRSLAKAHHLNLLGTLSKPFTSLSLRNLLLRFNGPSAVTSLHRGA